VDPEQGRPLILSRQRTAAYLFHISFLWSIKEIKRPPEGRRTCDLRDKEQLAVGSTSGGISDCKFLVVLQLAIDVRAKC
jgi:hypothetical protein